MSRITTRKVPIAREGGRLPTPALKAAGTMMVRESTEEVGQYGVRVAEASPGSDRDPQTFSDALRDSIRQNRSAIEKLSKR
ncbi:hypothetical protein ACFJIW_08690 [Tahibacter sp. UC22_41]|uniref:hypothetical protein n=1 Tax=Tahibacter sp. UC22_41 TaxID=3350178 RepID=UPI0036D8F873